MLTRIAFFLLLVVLAGIDIAAADLGLLDIAGVLVFVACVVLWWWLTKKRKRPPPPPPES